MSTSHLRAVRRIGLGALALGLLAGCATPAPPPPVPQPTPIEARIATLRNLGFVEAHDEWELSLGVKLLFDSDVHTLSDEGRKAVSDVAVELGKIGITRVRVEGHTDNVGSAKYNMRLSEMRAESVVQRITRAGWRGDVIERKGYGADKPVADNATPAGRAQNRRVVIAVQAN